MVENNQVYMEKYDSSSANNDARDHIYENDPSTIVDDIYLDVLQDNRAGSWFSKFLKLVEQATNPVTLKSNTTNTFSMILIAIAVLLAPLFILGFFDSHDQELSYGELLYHSILQLVDTIWSFCMAPFDAVLRLVSPASYSPLLADEDDIQQDEAAKGPSPRQRILRSLVAKTQQTMPPLVPIPGALEKRGKPPNLKQPQPPPELEPAFLNPEDYPPGWLVFHPELGVVSKEEADAHDQNKETEMETSTAAVQKQESEEEKEGQGGEVLKMDDPGTTLEGKSVIPIAN